MKNPRILIICFDGLNRKAVEKYDLKYIKQVEYGDVIVPGVFSGMLWSTFVTGKDRTVHGIDSWNRKALETFNYFKQEKGIDTLLSIAKKPIEKYYPFIDPRWKVYLGIEHDYNKIMKVNTSVFVEALLDISKDWDLFLVCFMIIDNLGHNNSLKEEYYRLIDSWVGILKDRGNPTWTLVIGDKDPNHRPPGFYSSSKTLSLNKPKLKDFFNLIKEELEY